MRRAPQRLEGEAIRDSMLAVSGRLNPRLGGPSMYPEVPKEALAGSSDPAVAALASDPFIFPDATISAELHVFGECGHWTQVEKHQAFAELVLSFFRR